MKAVKSLRVGLLLVLMLGGCEPRPAAPRKLPGLDEAIQRAEMTYNDERGRLMELHMQMLERKSPKAAKENPPRESQLDQYRAQKRRVSAAKAALDKLLAVREQLNEQP